MYMSLRKYGNRNGFYYKKSYLEHRLQKDVMENGIAYIPCKVEGLGDIISKFSIKGCETLDADFVGYLLDFIDCVPMEYPVVLEIHGPKFTEEEKSLITEVIKSDADYLLGTTDAQNKRHRKVFWWMVVGTIGSGILLALINKLLSNIPLEFFYVIFWLFADALVRYLFIENNDYRDDRIRAGRIASMEVEFAED